MKACDYAVGKENGPDRAPIIVPPGLVMRCLLYLVSNLTVEGMRSQHRNRTLCGWSGWSHSHTRPLPPPCGLQKPLGNYSTAASLFVTGLLVRLSQSPCSLPLSIRLPVRMLIRISCYFLFLLLISNYRLLKLGLFI